MSRNSLRYQTKAQLVGVVEPDTERREVEFEAMQQKNMR
jgi:hypothetical protein